MLLEFDADQRLWQETVRDAVATAGMELNGLLVLHTRDIVDI